MNNVIDPKTPAIGKALLGRLARREITMEEFDMETAYWLYEHIDTMRYKGAPAMPREYHEYSRSKQNNPAFQAKPEFWKMPEVEAYVRLSTTVKADNASNLFWLYFMRKNIMREDTVKQEKIALMLRSHGENVFAPKARAVTA